MGFVNLHVHTAYSLLDSISKPEDIIKKVKEMGQLGVAISDHGNTYAHVKIYKICKQYEIKYIHGCELYIAPKSRFEKDKNERYYHLLALVKNEQGRINLNKLITLSNLEGMYYKNRVDFEILEQYKDGLIITSACMGGEISRALMGGNTDRAKEIALKYKSVFGDDYYLEVQSHREPEQQKLNRQISDLAKELNIKLVATADAHYINKEDQDLHSIFVQIGQAREVGETYSDCYLQSEDDIRNILSGCMNEDEISEAINSTEEIMNKCNVKIPLSAPIIPHVKIPEKYESEDEYLKVLCNEGWKKRGINKLPKEEREKYKERLFYEFDAVSRMKFSGYFLLVYSYANTVKRRGIARGSGGGSLIAYLLNIVDIDPIVYGLYFERFIDVGALDLLESGKIGPEELKTPDFDLGLRYRR